MILSSCVPPWARQDFESTDDYSYFLSYLRACATGSKAPIEAASHATGRSAKHLTALAENNVWQDRADSFARSADPIPQLDDDPLCFVNSGSAKVDADRSRRRMSQLASKLHRAITADAESWYRNNRERDEAFAKMKRNPSAEVYVPPQHKPSAAVIRALPDLIQIELAIRDGAQDDDAESEE